MPLYEYRCNACQEVTEVRHGFGEGFPGVCPSCGASAMTRVFSPTGIVFKGSGFYINDSRKPSAAQAAQKPAGSADKPADAPAEKPAADKPAAAAAAPATPAATPAAAPVATTGPQKSESSAA